MTLTNLAFASGLSSLMIVIIGWLLGLYLVKRYLASPDNNTLALAVILISIGSVWLAIAINFILALLGMSFLQPLPYILLIGWIPGVVGLAIGYVFISIIKEEYLKPTMIIFGLFFIVNAVINYVLIPFNYFNFSPETSITFDTPINDLPNATTAGLFRYLSIITIIIMLVTSIFFILTAVRTDIPLVKTRAGLLGIGFLMISILIAFDSVFNLTDLLVLVAVRVLIVIGLFIMAMAITLPKRIFKNLA